MSVWKAFDFSVKSEQESCQVVYSWLEVLPFHHFKYILIFHLNSEMQLGSMLKFTQLNGSQPRVETRDHCLGLTLGNSDSSSAELVYSEMAGTSVIFCAIRFKNKFYHSSPTLGILVLTFLIKDSDATTTAQIHSNIYTVATTCWTCCYTLRNAKINKGKHFLNYHTYSFLKKGSL